MVRFKSQSLTPRIDALFIGISIQELAKSQEQNFGSWQAGTILTLKVCAHCPNGPLSI